MLGIIGGSGLYQFDDLEVIEKQHVTTPFGKPSAALVCGRYEGVEVAFLPRHGEHHQYLPSEVNYRANIWALKALGVRRIIGVSAVGSLRESIQPGDISLPAQYFDWTKGVRRRSFFGDGIVAHVSTAEPVCAALSNDIAQAAKVLSMPLHTETTYACIEGPRLGTRAESLFLQNTGGDLVGMTNVPEVFLAREAQLSYCTIAITTDYDCWLKDPSLHVNASQAMAKYQENTGKVKSLLRQVILQPFSDQPAYCRESLKDAIMTPMAALTPAQQELLAFLQQ